MSYFSRAVRDKTDLFEVESSRSNSPEPEIFDNHFSDLEDDGPSWADGDTGAKYDTHERTWNGAHSYKGHINKDAIPLIDGANEGDDWGCMKWSKHDLLESGRSRFEKSETTGDTFRRPAPVPMHVTTSEGSAFARRDNDIPVKNSENTLNHDVQNSNPNLQGRLSPIEESNFKHGQREQSNTGFSSERGYQHNQQGFPTRPYQTIDTTESSNASYYNPAPKPAFERTITCRRTADDTAYSNHEDGNRTPDDNNTSGYSPQDWFLSEDDRYGPSMILNESDISNGPVSDTDFYGSIQPPKIRKQKFPRVFHKRSGTSSLMDSTSSMSSGLQQVMSASPLAMVAKIAKEAKLDVTTLLETADKMGFPMPFPCMQCYEKYGSARDTGYDLDEYGYERTKDGRCPKCGGQVATLATFGKMISQMRQTINDKNLIAHDVYPDGNCLFGAIIDQLRIHGNFQYTINNLRHAAVDYLRRNPDADDGTPFAMFLTEEETWEAYLKRMNEDGEWGDHMVLSAISNVLQQTIHIYGGISGQGETVIVPKGQVLEEKENSPTDVPTANPQKTPCLYLGHFGESHYISLRPRNWHDQLQKRMKEHRLKWLHQVKHASRKIKHDVSMEVPITHINFILKQIFQLEFVSSKFEKCVDLGILTQTFDETKCVVEYFGSVINKLEPHVVKIECISPEVSMFFPPAKDSTVETNVKPTVTMFQIPKDSQIVVTKTEARRSDLVLDRDPTVIGHMKLVPNNPRKWEGFTYTADNGKVYLIPFELPKEKVSSMVTSLLKSENTPNVEMSIAFHCMWPDEATEWITRHRETNWPDARTIQTVHSLGCHVIPVIEKEKFADILDEFITEEMLENKQTWIFSFTLAEKEISRFISDSQRSSYLLFRLFVDEFLQRHQLPNAVVKSIFFYACENIERSKWKTEPGDCLLILLKRLEIGLRRRRIPHYFLAEKNLLQNIPAEFIQSYLEKIECARRQPMISLYFLFDHHNLTSSEIGAFLDDIIEDSFRFTQHHDISRSINEAVIPAGCLLLQNFIHQGQYRYAMCVALELKEEIRNSSGRDVTLSYITKTALWENVGYQWCFALYLDLNMRTTLTRDVCEGYSTVHVTEVFGPEILGEFPDTVIPFCFAIQSGDLMFPIEVTKVLQQLENNKAITKCLRYYIDTYNGIVGVDGLYLCSHCQKGGRGAVQSHMCAYPTLLQCLHIKLFNAYLDLDTPGEFRDMMPRLTKLTEFLGSPSAYKGLKDVWRMMGEPEKTNEIERLTGKPKLSAFQQLFGELMGGDSMY